jgi:hypothetical protein
LYTNQEFLYTIARNFVYKQGIATIASIPSNNLIMREQQEQNQMNANNNNNSSSNNNHFGSSNLMVIQTKKDEVFYKFSFLGYYLY